MTGPAAERKDDVARVSMWDARDALTELVDKAISGDPQILTRYGRDTVVILGVKEYERLRALEPSAD